MFRASADDYKYSVDVFQIIPTDEGLMAVCYLGGNREWRLIPLEKIRPILGGW